MTDLPQRRRHEINRYVERYKRPHYDMKLWRREILMDWLKEAASQNPGAAYLGSVLV